MKILMAMSGGVDSSMSAKMLKDAGHEVIGCYMKLHERPIYHEENIKKVKHVGKFLGIETTVLDLQKDFKELVYDPFIQIYKDGKTPNPCALCNKEIKLGKLLEFALSLGCDKLATGHYVRLENNLIKIAVDLSKDQSYFIANVSKDSLKYMIFPLGGLYKKDVKLMAAKFPELVAIAGQKESSEICFVENTYIDVLNEHFNTQMPGLVRDMSGNVVGKHNGYMHYTIGKRKGFTVDGAHDPHYVVDIDSDKNEIVVGTKEDLFKTSFELSNLNTFVDVQDEFEAFVKIRYKSPKVKAKVTVLKGQKNSALVNLLEPVGGIAKSQLAVFYNDNDCVIASGFIA